MVQTGIIVGVDPGTTTAWAVLDLSGKVLEVGSSKGFGLSNVLRVVHALGRVYAVGTDKRVVPGLVASVAAKLGGRVCAPKSDLAKEYKHDLIKGGLVKEIKYNNLHEFDALASACFAYRQLLPLLERVRRASSEEEVSYEDLAMAVLDSGLGIKASVEFLDDVRKRRAGLASLRSESINVVVAKESIAIRSIRRERDELRRVVDSSHKEVIRMRLQLDDQSKRFSTSNLRSTGQDASHKDRLLMVANQRAQSLAALARNLRKRSESLESAMLDPSSVVVCRRMQNLGMRECERLDKIKRIQLGDILFVSRTGESTGSSLQKLRDVGVVIVTSEPVDKGLRDRLGLAIVHIDSQAIAQFESVVLINKAVFDSAKKETSLIEDVIGSYREERAVLGR